MHLKPENMLTLTQEEGYTSWNMWQRSYIGPSGCVTESGETVLSCAVWGG